MYIPHHFKNENLEEVKSFIQENSFGILLTRGKKRMLGAHIPLELETGKDGNELIYGHISKANPQWSTYQNDDEVLCIFNGAQAYVSSSWYDHENVSTWNYIAVHVYGKIEILDEEELLFSLNKLVDKYESKMENPFRMKDMSKQTLNQVKGIVGFKIYITDIQAAYKLSQNRNEADYNNIINKLNSSDNAGDQEMGREMNEKRSTGK